MTGKTYYQLWDKLVPSSGEAETVQGEMVRCIGRLYRDLDRDLEAVEKIVTDYCNSHPELIEAPFGAHGFLE
ncbi:MAG: hypothetical protein WCH04_21590 [Gammaproteobacteria bacterium]